MSVVLLRLPFTLSMLIALIAAGVYGHSHVGPLDDSIHRNSGYSIRLMIEGEVHRAVTSIFFTAGGWKFYSSIAMFAVAVGWIEFNLGTQRALTTFFGIHFTTLITMTALVYAWNLIGNSQRANLLWDVQDVGPSAGYYGCIGLALVAATCQIRWPLAIVLVVVLCLRAAWSFSHLSDDGRILSADLAHLIALPLGIASFQFTV